MIQFWGDRMHETGRYDHLLGGQRTAFKALHPEVSVTLLRNTVHVRDLLEKQGACP